MPQDCGLFRRITVNTALPVGQFISWEMIRTFKGTPPYNFYVDTAPTGSEDWTTLNKVAVVNDCMYYDPNKYNYSMGIDQEYRIRMVDGNGDVFYSNPFHPLGNWNNRDFLLAKELMRKEYLLQIKKTGIQGTLLKRRQWGTVCPLCLDFDTNEVTDNRCPSCFGTGFLGGYFKGIELWVTLSNLKRNKQITDLAVVDPFDRSGRCVAYPYLDTKDIWVNNQTNERYAISEPTNVAEIRGIPIVYTAMFSKAPASSILYDVPLTTTVDLSGEYDNTAINSPVKLDNNDPINVNNAPVVPPEEQWDEGVNADPESW